MQTDFIIDQLDELKLCLEVDSDIYKLAARIFFCCCAALCHLKKKNLEDKECALNCKGSAFVKRSIAYVLFLVAN